MSSIVKHFPYCPVLYMSSVMRNLSSGFPTKSDTKRAVQPQKIATGLKFGV